MTNHSPDMPNVERQAAVRRARELMLDRASVGLSASEEAELRRLMSRWAIAPDDGYEAAASALDVAMSGGAPAMPSAPRARIQEAGRLWGEARRRELAGQGASGGSGFAGAELKGGAFLHEPMLDDAFAGRRGPGSDESIDADVDAVAGSGASTFEQIFGTVNAGGSERGFAGVRRVPDHRRRLGDRSRGPGGASGGGADAGSGVWMIRARSWGGWAAAACLLLVVLARPERAGMPLAPGAGDSGLAASGALGGTTAGAIASSGAEVDISRQAGVGGVVSPWLRLLQMRDEPRSDLVAFTLTRADVGGPSGEIHWSAARQEGFVRLSNLPPIDPRLETFQVWVRDGARDQRHPVSAGIFDAPAPGPEASGAAISSAGGIIGGDVLVAIRAALPITTLDGFVITIEPKGGVPVSSGGAVVAVASVRDLVRTVSAAGAMPEAVAAEPETPASTGGHGMNDAQGK
jgi:hypothetical protein